MLYNPVDDPRYMTWVLENLYINVCMSIFKNFTFIVIEVIFYYKSESFKVNGF